MSAPRFAGDVDVVKVEITGDSGSFDITKLTIGIDVYENIFYPFVRGIITVDDAQDTINKINFKQTEYLNLEFNTPDKKGYKGKYYIYKIDNRSRTNDKKVIYSIYFSHEAMLHEANSKIAENFNDKPHTIVQQIIKKSVPKGLEYSDKVEVEECSNKLQYVSPFWTPCQNIYYLTKLAISTKNNPAYLFFQNNEGYHFVTFDKLIEQEPKAKLKQDNFDHSPDSSCALSNFDEHYERVLNIKFPQFFNQGYEALEGVFKSVMMTYNQFKKTYEEKENDDNYDSTDHLNDSKRMKTPPKVTKFANKDRRGQKEQTFDGQEDGTNNSTKQNRAAIFARYARGKTTITIFGNSELYAGNVVELDIMKYASLDDGSGSEGTTDETYSGKYIISAVGHHVNKEKYETHLELIRDSFKKSEEEKKQDPEEKKPDEKKPDEKAPTEKKPADKPSPPPTGKDVPTFSNANDARRYADITGKPAKWDTSLA